MKRNRMTAAVSAVIASLVLLLCFSQTAYSASQSGTVKLRYVLSDTRFELYRIGELTDTGFQLSQPFDVYHVDLNNPDAAYTLAAYVERDHIEPLASAVTDSSYCADFEALEEGVYLLTGDSGVIGQGYYSVNPSLFEMSYSDGGSVEIEVKYGVTQGARRSRLSCLKIWEDDGETHPEITASLLCDGELYETFVLNEENNWTHVWFDLDMTHEWMIAEDLDDDEYTVSVSREGNTITIVNTMLPGPPFIASPGSDSTTPEPTTPEPTTSETTTSATPDSDSPATVSETASSRTSIPQTGQFNWIIYVLIISGALLCLIGVTLSRKERNEKK